MEGATQKLRGGGLDVSLRSSSSMVSSGDSFVYSSLLSKGACSLLLVRCHKLYEDTNMVSKKALVIVSQRVRDP